MQIVIDMDEKSYKTIMNTSFVVDIDKMINASTKDNEQLNAIFMLIDALDNGTPLSKGHGDLYDDKALKKAFEEDGSLDAYKYATDRVSTIIEADKGEG